MLRSVPDLTMMHLPCRCFSAPENEAHLRAASLPWRQSVRRFHKSHLRPKCLFKEQESHFGQRQRSGKMLECSSIGYPAR